MLKPIAKFIAGVTTAALLSACGSESSTSETVFREPVDTTKAVTEIIDLIALPAVNDFSQQVNALQTASTTFCAARTAENLTAVQNQWKATAEAWYRYLPYNIGPSLVGDDAVLIEVFAFIDSLRYRGNDATSAIRTDIKRMLASSADNNFSNKNYDDLGLLPLELTLFERASDQSKSNSDILAAFNDIQCDILAGYNSALIERSNMIKNGWTANYKNSNKSYRDLLINGGLDDLPAEKGTPANAKLILSTNEFMDYIHKRKIVDGETSVTAAISGHTWQLMTQAVSSFEKMIEGTTGTTESFADLLQKNAPNSLATIRSNIALVKKNITDQNAIDFYAAVLAVDGNIKRELKTGLDINTGLNFSDGD